jgi:hypothetical protein
LGSHTATHPKNASAERILASAVLQHGSRKHWQYSFQARILSPSECKKLLHMEKEVDCKFTDLNMRRRAHTHGKALMLYHQIIGSKL